MRVLGVDPGLTRCGLGVVEGRRGRTVALVAVDVVTTPAGDDLAARLLGIGQAVGEWMDQVHPDVVAVERVFSQANVRTVMGTAQAAGVAILAAAQRGIPVAVHTPSEVKAAVTGDGRAGKLAVATMVTRILDLPAAPRPADAADALALAICHLWRGDAVTAAGGSGRATATKATAATAAQERWREAAAAARRAGPPSARTVAAKAALAALTDGASPGPGRSRRVR